MLNEFEKSTIQDESRSKSCTTEWPESPRSDCSVDVGGHDEGKGRWTSAEHDRFMHAVSLYPRGPWKQIGSVVKTRSIRQIQTHAQKLREKAARHERGLKIKIKDQLAVILPSCLWSKGHHRDADNSVNKVEEEEKEDPTMPPLEECLDFLIDAVDNDNFIE